MKLSKLNKNNIFKLTYQKGLLVFLISLIMLFAFLEDFIILKPKVLFGLTENIMEIGLMALPMTLIITTGGIDLSVGTTMALSAVVTGAVYEATGVIGFAVACGIITGILCGAFNGFIISRTKISPLVTTLASMSLYLGIAKIIGGTKIFSNFPEGFSFLQKNKMFGVIPYQFVLFIVLFIIFNYFYTKGTLGRCVRGMGLTEEAVKYSGINIKKIKFRLYTLSGFMSAVAAMIYLSHLPAAKPDIGMNLNLQAITAVVFGGTSINGGIGSMTGTFLGILVLGVLKKGLQLIGFGGDMYSFILGLVLIVSLIGFSYIQNRKNRVSTIRKNIQAK